MLATFLLICLISTLCSIIVFVAGFGILRGIAKRKLEKINKENQAVFDKIIKELEEEAEKTFKK